MLSAHKPRNRDAPDRDKRAEARPPGAHGAARLWTAEGWPVAGRGRQPRDPARGSQCDLTPCAHAAALRRAALPPTPALILIAVLVGSDAIAPRDLGAPHPPPRPPPHGPPPSANAQNPDGKVWGRFGCPRGGGGGAPGIWGAETRQPLSAPRDRAASPGRQCC